VENVIPWNGGIVAVNSFGVGGANGHCLMKSYTQQKKELQVLEEQLPRLVAVSARNESAINYMLNRVITLLLVPMVDFFLCCCTLSDKRGGGKLKFRIFHFY